MEHVWFVVKSMNLEPETGAQVQTLSQMTRSPISPSLGWCPMERLMVSITARRPGIRGVVAVMFPWQKRWVSVGQGQEMDQKREAEAPPGGLKGQAKPIGCYSEAAGSCRQGSLLSREQMFKAGSGGWRGGGEIGGVEAEQKAATKSPERDSMAQTCPCQGTLQS